MPEFKYTITHISGKVREVTVEAETEEEAVSIACAEMVKFSKEMGEEA